MAANESEHSPKKSEKSPEEDWGDAWGGEEPQEQAESPAAQSPESTKKQDDLSSVPEGLDDFKAARRKAQLEEGFPHAPRSKRVERKEMPLETVTVDRQSIEDKEWGQPTVFSAKWTTFITLAILGMIIACLVLMQQSGPATKSGKANSKKEQRQKMIEAIEAEINELNGREEEARKMYADFASAQLVEEILPMIRNSKELGDLIRRVGHQPIVDKDWEPRANSKWAMNLLEAKPFATLSGELPDFTNFRAYYVLEGDLLLLDWKATTGYSSASFGDLAQGKGDGSEVRGYVKPASLYYGDFTEDSYHCYQVASPDKREVLWCYVKRSTDEAKELGRFFLKGEIIEEKTEEMAMTLKLSRKKGMSMPNQWLIEGLLHDKWIQIQ